MTQPTASRRSFLAAAAGLAAAGAALGQQRRYGPGAEPTRYPDPDLVALDKRFDKYKIGNTPIRRLHTGTLWAEGCAWCGGGRYLVWSDIPNNVQLRWLDDDGHVSVLRHPAGNSNGNTFDWNGRQISFEHGNRRVVRYDHNGGTTVLADKWEGKRLNAPNDGACLPDNSLFFTDPGYGSLMHYEGNKGPLEIQEAVYRVDGASGKMTKVAGRDDGLYKPNGLCFSPDYKKCYIADTGASHYEGVPKNVRVFDVVDDGKKLANGREFVSMEMAMKTPAGLEKKAGLADGIRCDTDGNLWIAAGWVGDGYDGVHVCAPDGTRIGQIRLPEICGNLCFGGEKRNRLFMAASQSLYAVYVEAQGAGCC